MRLVLARAADVARFVVAAVLLLVVGSILCAVYAVLFFWWELRRWFRGIG